MKVIYRIYILLSIIFAAAGMTQADTVTTINGSTMIGEVTTITKEFIHLKTDYAGTIQITTGQITELSTNHPITTRLEDGTVVSGVTEISNENTISIENETMTMTASMDRLLASWQPDSQPPEAAGFPRERYWQYRIGSDITGKRGNSKENGASVRADAILKGENDELMFYTSIERADTDGEETSDEIILGSSYVSYFSEAIGWFVSSELERDPFESIDLRASVSGGLSYWLYNQSDFSLELQTGFGYRHESFDDSSSEDAPTLDLRLRNHWQITSWIDMTNTLSFIPSLSDFNDYLIFQDSGLNMPLGDSRWSLRLGLKNSYANEPAIGRKKLDTTYYSRLLLNFF